MEKKQKIIFWKKIIQQRFSKSPILRIFVIFGWVKILIKPNVTTLFDPDQGSVPTKHWRFDLNKKSNSPLCDE